MTPDNDDPLDVSNSSPELPEGIPPDLVKELLGEIVRVKELIKYYDAIPDGAGHLGSSILNELVSEAYTSLVNYDVILMRKYYALLQNCD